MTLFREFTGPVWKIFFGNLLMLAASAFYIAWWSVLFAPGAAGHGAGSGAFIAAAAIAGAAAIAVLAAGIGALPRSEKGYPPAFIPACSALLFILFLALTRIVFQRPVTSELLLIFVWAAVELSAVNALVSSGRFGLIQAVPLSILVALAACTGIVCYILYYRLDPVPRFWDGLVPLIADAAAAAVFSGVIAFS